MQHIDEELARRNWTRSQLANKSGLSSSYFTMVSKGARAVGAEACNKIAAALGMQPETVMEWAGILKTKKGENPLTKELGDVADQLSDDDIYDLIDLARAKKARREAATRGIGRPKPA